MTYQVLARKWRPQDFASLVGQEPIVTALRNALSQERIAQAYVFSGIRGVGKTTAARVFAKALNCESEVGSAERGSVDPCNTCPSCRDITDGRDLLNVREIDAATYSKVEQVRELTDSLRQGATRPDRYMIVIMDEVHRLSRQAFDALLKIVEEPPPRLVFIFATTELDAVPATILSRCQEFQFRRVASPALAAYLRTIAAAEEIEVSDPALRMIARAGEGSVRDSVALLDQLATFGGSTIRDEDAQSLLGGLDAAVLHDLLRAILQSDGASITALVREVEANGWDPHNVYNQFLTYCRDALHLTLGGVPETLDLPLEEAEALGALVRPAGYENLLRLIQLLLQSEATVRRSELGLLALEIVWLRAAELPKLTRIEDLLSGAPLPTTAAALPSPPPRRVEVPRPAPRPRVASAVVEPPAMTAGPEQIDTFRKKFRAGTAPAKALLRAEIEIADNELRIHCSTEDRKLLESRMANLEKKVVEIFGDGVKLCLLEGAAPAPSRPVETAVEETAVEETTVAELKSAPNEAPPRETPPKNEIKTKTENGVESSDPDAAREVEEHPTVQKVLDLFGGTIQSIQSTEES